jgi:diguanylate cyclase (GGDEF)-like protein
MERSPRRTPMSQRSKAACTVAALTVGFGCAVIGVGGADGGTSAYARHVREARLEARLAGIALAHRSPEQVVLAIAPKHHAVRSAAHVAALTPVSSVSATTATTPAAAATTTPATTTTSTTTTPTATTTSGTTTTPTATTTSGTTTTPTATTTSGTTTTPTATTTTTTGTTTTGTTTTPTATTTTGTTTTGTTTTTTGTTTTTTGTTTTGTGTTTTGTTTTGTPASATSTTGNGASTILGHGRQPGTTSTTTTSLCFGRCVGSGGTSSATQAAVPAASSASSTGNFSVTPATVTPASVATSVPATPVNDSSSTNLPVSSGTATTPAPITPTAPTPAGSQSSTGLLHINLPNIATALKHAAANGSSTSRRSAAGVITATGTGATTGGTGAGGAPTGTAGATGTGTAGGTTAANTGTHAPAHHTPKHTSSNNGSGGIAAPVVKDIYHFVNVIPTAVWLALGAAFALMLAFAAIAFRSSRRARRRENEFAAISAAALTDALTGILNRRGFTEAAERELARASRYERPFVLAYVDVRGLKSVNDTEGHLMGDELIKTVADLMKESARADDVVGRIGGDEFALLLGEQTAESAGPVFRRIGARVEEARAGMEISVPWELTIGMASFPQDGTTLEELLEVSDRRLYEQRGIALR